MEFLIESGLNYNYLKILLTTIVGLFAFKLIYDCNRQEEDDYVYQEYYDEESNFEVRSQMSYAFSIPSTGF